MLNVCHDERPKSSSVASALQVYLRWLVILHTFLDKTPVSSSVAFALQVCLRR